jgi:hypothetical protein
VWYARLWKLAHKYLFGLLHVFTSAKKNMFRHTHSGLDGQYNFHNNCALPKGAEIATGCTAGVRFPAEARYFFLYFTASRPAMGYIESSTQWILGGSSPRVKGA